MNKGIWVICPTCDGHGKHSRRFGAMTVEELEDEDFAEAYVAGAYDALCEDCKGSGKQHWESDEQRREAQREAYADRRTRWAECGYPGNFCDFG